MNIVDLAVKLVNQNSLSEDQAKSIDDDLLKEMVDAVSSSAEVSLPGFGKFKVKEKAARDDRHPSTGEIIKIAASKKLSLTPAKTIRDRLNAA